MAAAKTLACIALGIGAASAPSLAQDVVRPPVKPGLWQVAITRDVNGQKTPDMSERLAAMSPQARQQMEAMMKQRGVDLSGGAGKTRVCLSRESLDEGRWMRSSGRCKTDYLSRTDTAWKWRSVCTGPASHVDGEAVFASPESYTVKMAITTGPKDKPKIVNQTIQANWTMADCGDVKPLQPPGKP